MPCVAVVAEVVTMAAAEFVAMAAAAVVTMAAAEVAIIEGRRDTLLSLSQVVRSGNIVAFVTLWLAGLAGLFFGGRSIVYDLSVTWKTADAVLTDITLLDYPSWKTYRFITDAGQSVYPDDSAKAYAKGGVVRMYYVESDPNDNYPADDPLPRSVRDWFFVALGAFMLSSGVYCMRSALSIYRALRRIAHSGKPIPGEITNSQLLKLKVGPDGIPEPLEVKIDYVAIRADGDHFGSGEATIPLHHMPQPALPNVGTKVAIWYAEKERAGVML
jgi:hypothetical protein